MIDCACVFEDGDVFGARCDGTPQNHEHLAATEHLTEEGLHELKEGFLLSWRGR